MTKTQHPCLMTPINEKVPRAGAYPKSLYHEATKSISTPSCMGCWPITGLPPTLKICQKCLLTSSNIYIAGMPSGENQDLQRT